MTDEEVIEGISFTAYHRISTVIFVPAEAGCAVEMMTIDPMDLQAVHEQDVAMLAVHSVVGRIVGHHKFSWSWNRDGSRRTFKLWPTSSPSARIITPKL